MDWESVALNRALNCKEDENKNKTGNLCIT
jgi:hypothetical protein